jgi:S-adenosyl-L-methionine hydrolase (adenosine-forming)
MEGLVPQIPASAEAIITLTTDFGLDDAYVAAMKGVILDINPGATIVDISHSIEPQNIRQGAFVFSTAYTYFPQDSVHLVVVDPGVGGPRRAIILETENAIFVAPDNGVLSHVIQASARKRISRPTLMKLPPEIQAFEITNSKYWRHPVSSTFHGRDIFAPVAAHISLGKPLNELGQAIASVNVFPPSRPKPDADGNLIGHILHIDHFGNLITDIASQDLPSGKFSIEVAGRRISSLSQSYEPAQELLALIGSSGRLEIALKGGCAARLLGSKVSDVLRLVSRRTSRDRG